MNPQQQPPSPPPTTPKKEVQLLGPRPTPLKLSKDSVKIRKPPPHPHLFRHNPLPPQHQQQQQQPVVIYTVSPKVIHTSANEFMSLVQRLTGPSSSPPGDLSPAARLASIEKISPSSNNSPHFPATNTNTTDPTSTLGHGLSTSTTNDDAFMDSIMELGVDLMGQFPSSILSPAPATMQPIPAGYFSPATEDPHNGFSWQGLATGNNYSGSGGFSSFAASPSALFSAPLVSPSPSSWDLFNNFLAVDFEAS